MTSSEPPTAPTTLAQQLETARTKRVYLFAEDERIVPLERLVAESGLEVASSAAGLPVREAVALVDGEAGAKSLLSTGRRELAVLFVHASRNELLPLLEAGYRFGPEVQLDEGRLLRRGKAGEYRIHRYRDGDEAEILDLFRSAFHVDRSVEHWRWKYVDCPYGASRISVVRGPDDELVGQYCAYPVPFLPRGEANARIVHQVGDTMTAPSVRAVGRGHGSLLASTAQHFYAAFCRDRVDFNFGFNTGNIRKFSTRFVGAEEIENVRFRVAQRDGVDARRRFLAPRARREQHFDAAYDEFFHRVRSHYGALLQRDARYLSWRYAGRPDLDYRWFALRRRRISGWGVFCRRDATLVWGDALFDPPAARDASALLHAALESFEAQGPIERIVGWFPDRPGWWHRALQELGFVEADEPQELGLVAVPFNTPRTELVRGLKDDLYYAYGDSDLF
ncbi:MAG: GNAT family N-acetyltransferase [Acidobacteriota bacterium]